MAQRTGEGLQVRNALEEPARTEDGAFVVQSAVSYRVGGREYAMRTSALCRVCTSDRRIAIENAILRGHTTKAIEQALAAEGRTVARTSIQGHIDKHHMPLDVTVQRTIVEQRAKEMGELLEDAEGSLVDAIGVLRAVQQRGYERMASGDIEPDLGDTLAASKLLLQIQPEGDLDRDLFFRAIYRMMEMVRARMGHAEFQALARDFRQDPILRSIEDQFPRQELTT